MAFQICIIISREVCKCQNRGAASIYNNLAITHRHDMIKENRREMNNGTNHLMQLQ